METCDCGNDSDYINFYKCYCCDERYCNDCLGEEYGKRVCHPCGCKIPNKIRLKRRLAKLRKTIRLLETQVEMIENEIILKDDW